MFSYVSLDYSQSVLIDKINAYQQLKNRPLISKIGYCHGLTVLWLSKMAEQKSQWFYDMVRYIVHTNPKDYDEILFEKFLAQIEFGQHPLNSGLNITQRHLQKILEMSNIESTDFNGAYPNLHKKIRRKKHPAMYLISHVDPDTKIGHAIGVFHQGDTYQVYDSNYTTGRPRVFDSKEAAAKEIMQRLLSKDKQTEGATFNLELNYIPLMDYLSHPSDEVAIDIPEREDGYDADEDEPEPSYRSCTLL